MSRTNYEHVSKDLENEFKVFVHNHVNDIFNSGLMSQILPDKVKSSDMSINNEDVSAIISFALNGSGVKDALVNLENKLNSAIDTKKQEILDGFNEFFSSPDMQDAMGFSGLNKIIFDKDIPTGNLSPEQFLKVISYLELNTRKKFLEITVVDLLNMNIKKIAEDPQAYAQHWISRRNRKPSSPPITTTLPDDSNKNNNSLKENEPDRTFSRTPTNRMTNIETTPKPVIIARTSKTTQSQSNAEKLALDSTSTDSNLDTNSASTAPPLPVSGNPFLDDDEDSEVKNDQKVAGEILTKNSAPQKPPKPNINLKSALGSTSTDSNLDTNSASTAPPLPVSGNPFLDDDEDSGVKNDHDVSSNLTKNDPTITNVKPQKPPKPEKNDSTLTGSPEKNHIINDSAKAAPPPNASKPAPLIRSAGGLDKDAFNNIDSNNQTVAVEAIHTKNSAPPPPKETTTMFRKALVALGFKTAENKKWMKSKEFINKTPNEGPKPNP